MEPTSCTISLVHDDFRVLETLVQAVKEYDPDYKVQFASYCDGFRVAIVNGDLQILATEKSRLRDAVLLAAKYWLLKTQPKQTCREKLIEMIK
jgi:hypothetical protein